MLVLPGLILGALGVRNSRRTGAGLVRSWLGIGLSVLLGGRDHPRRSAARVQPGRRRRLRGLPGQRQGRGQPGRRAAVRRPPRGQLRTSLSQAASRVNGAAARAQSVAVRSTLAALTGDLQSTLGEVTAGRPVPPLLRQELTGDIAAATHACS